MGLPGRNSLGSKREEGNREQRGAEPGTHVQAVGEDHRAGALASLLANGLPSARRLSAFMPLSLSLSWTEHVFLREILPQGEEEETERGQVSPIMPESRKPLFFSQPPLSSGT